MKTLGDLLSAKQISLLTQMLETILDANGDLWVVCGGIEISEAWNRFWETEIPASLRKAPSKEGEC